MMRSLLPPLPDGIDLFAADAMPTSAPAGRPLVRVNMTSSLDGGIAIKGGSGGLGGPGDQCVFHTLRALTDVVLVGAGTMRTEGHGPVRLDQAQQAQRQGGVTPPSRPSRWSPARVTWTSPFSTQAQARPLS